MRLGLLGYPVEHSLSPELYKRYLSDQLTSYDLFSFPSRKEVPPLSYFAKRLEGLNITSPYKKHFFSHVYIESEVVKKIGAINTIAFKGDEAFGTNTDYLALKKIYSEKYRIDKDDPFIILLGDGVMANLTRIFLSELGVTFQQYSRKTISCFDHLDISSLSTRHRRVLVINSCSRDYVFRGKLHGHEDFWDYNYRFSPHQDLFKNRPSKYQDGQELLEIQAKEAISFWSHHDLI